MPKLWSTEELQLLDELWGQISVAAIAARLGRSKTAVQQKGYALHGSPLARNEDVTITELGRSLGIHRKVIGEYWVKRHGLPMRKRVLLRGRQYHMVDIEEFWRWAKKHQELIDTKRFEPLVLGAEPDWMTEKRRRDAFAKTSKWSQEELYQLNRLMRTTDMTVRDIAKQIGRSESAVNAKLRRIRKKLPKPAPVPEVEVPPEERIERIRWWLERSKKRQKSYIDKVAQDHVEWLLERLAALQHVIEASTDLNSALR